MTLRIDRRRRLYLAGIGAAVIALVTTAITVSAPQRAAAEGVAAPIVPSCAWGVNISAGDGLNVLYPDTDATYFNLPFVVQPGLTITLHGQYPDSRYASFSVYDKSRGTFTTNGVASALADYQVAPDPGSVNPWQRQAAPGGRFTLTVTPDPVVGEANTLPLAPSGTAAGALGALAFRVYLPAGGNYRTVRMPSVTFSRNGRSVHVPNCRGLDSAEIAALESQATSGSGTSTAPPPASALQFYRGPGGANGPNENTGYLDAELVPPGPGQVVVIRGRAPTWQVGDHPSPWPSTTGADVRYWSMCVNLQVSGHPVVFNRLPGGKSDPGCRDDEQTRLDAQGDYTYVVGTESQRASIERVPGVTFLPFSLDHPTATTLILLRNMLASSGFAQAVQNVPQNRSAASAAAVMGPYYPHTALCPLATLLSAGPAACLSP